MWKLYAILVKYNIVTILILVVLTVFSTVINKQLIEIIELLEGALIAILILGVPPYCFAYFLDTKKSELTPQVALLDIFFLFLFLYSFVRSLDGQLEHLSVLYDAPWPILGIRLAYRKNKKLLDFLKNNENNLS